jgi:hypothetical protein
MAAPQRISIVMEWENVQFSADDRVRQVLTALASQVDELATAVSEGRCPLEALLPLELLVLFDPERVPADEIERMVTGAVTACPMLRARFVPAPGLDYFAMKNHGARCATGDLVICLDSDVIPQPGWLLAIVGAFVDPDVSAIASKAFVRPDSLYSRTVALTWLFELPVATLDLRPARHFHANGAAFRRHVLLAHPYPDLPGQSRGAGWDLFLELTAAGICVYEHAGACLDHPPPNGLANYCRRAMVHGSDDWLSICRRRGARSGRLGRSIRRALRKWRSAVANLWCYSAKVGLSLPALPAAVGLVSLYFSCYFAGDLLARLRRPAAQRGSDNSSGSRLVEGESQEISAKVPEPAIPHCNAA